MAACVFVVILPFLGGAFSLIWGLWPSLLACGLSLWIARDPNQGASRLVGASQRSFATTVVLTIGFLGNAFWLWDHPDAQPQALRAFAPTPITTSATPGGAPP